MPCILCAHIMDWTQGASVLHIEMHKCALTASMRLSCLISN